ncbi:uncharacterized protein LOC143585268 [Bidens hawaiensis]|uniref:uncharacterized protein LOC143585268 n=1 Tax=Bidens hawaiensis TaxID=980011 RepID=UPI004049989D
MASHTDEECRRKETRVCYNCGEPGHIRPECPKLTRVPDNKAKNTDGPKRNARAFQLTAQEAAMIPDVIAGTFFINDVYAEVLFDSGANQSFINKNFCQALNQPLTKLYQVCIVETADGNSTCIYEVLQGNNINLLGHKFKANLLPMNLVGFDVILGMDWLAANHAQSYVIRILLRFVRQQQRLLQFKETKFLDLRSLYR